MTETLTRTPPAAVLRELRREVGFGCPVSGCRSPYLTWHHFDPPWHVRQHHNPAGMVALCLEHHAKANTGSFTNEQLRALKQAPHDPEFLAGEFDWRRRELLAVVGGNFYYQTPVIFAFRQQPVIWFNRDDEGYWLLNARMLTAQREPRLEIVDQFWAQVGTPADLECPPSGKLLHVRYANGDKIVVVFRESTQEALEQRYRLSASRWGLPFPITTVEVAATVGGTPIKFGPRHTELPGRIVITKSFVKNAGIGISLG